MTILIRQIAVGLIAIGLIAPNRSAQRATYTVDAAQSKLQIIVGKSGLLSALGHDHVIEASGISGSAEYDGADVSHDALTMSVPVSSLRVIDPGESEKTRAHVQGTMLGPEVLNAPQFPAITFSSTAASPAKPDADGWEGIDLNGVLKLHGVERRVRVPVHLRLDAGVLRARGRMTIRQTDFDMTPVAVAGGTVRVKNEVQIDFEILAAAQGGRSRATFPAPR